jgi:hypothetical protein
MKALLLLDYENEDLTIECGIVKTGDGFLYTIIVSDKVIDMSEEFSSVITTFEHLDDNVRMLFPTCKLKSIHSDV